FNAVDGDVTRLGPQTVDVDAGAATLCHAGLENDQVERIPSIERQGGDRLSFDNIPQGRVGCVDSFYRSFYLDDLSGTADLQGDVHSERRTHRKRVAGLAGLLEARCLHLDRVRSGQHGGKRVKPRTVGQLFERRTSGLI